MPVIFFDDENMFCICLQQLDKLQKLNYISVLLMMYLSINICHCAFQLDIGQLYVYLKYDIGEKQCRKYCLINDNILYL